MRLRNFTSLLLPPLPPDKDAAGDDDEREYELVDDAHQVELRGGHGDAAILRRFGTDGDEILVGGEPVDGVGGEVAVAIEADEAVGGPGRTADDHEAAFGTRLAGRVGSGDGEGERAFLVVGVPDVNLRRREVGG